MSTCDNLFHLGIISAIIEHSPYHIFWKDKDLKFAGCNQKFSQQFGFSNSSEIINYTDEDFPWSNDLRKKYLDDDLEVLRNGSSRLNFIEQQRQNDRTFKTMLVSKVPIYGADHNIIGIYGQYLDQTKKINLESKLTKQEKRCFYLLIKGLTSKLIGQRLQVSYRTVECHIDHIKLKLNCYSRTELIELAEEAELI